MSVAPSAGRLHATMTRARRPANERESTVEPASDTPLLQPTVGTAVRRHPWLVAAVVAVCALLGLAYSAVKGGPASTAAASIVVEDPATQLGLTTAPSTTYVADQVEILKLDVTVERAVAVLHGRGLGSDIDVKTFGTNLTVTAHDGTNLIGVAYTDPRPVVAQAAADAEYAAYRAMLQDQVGQGTAASRQRIQATIKSIDGQLASLSKADPARISLVQARSTELQQLAQLPTAGDQNAVGVKAYSPPRLPKLETRNGPLPTSALGGILGLLPAVGLAYVVAQRRRRFSGRFQPELVLEQPLLAEVPVFSAEHLPSDVPALDTTGSSAAEAFRFLSTAVGVQTSTEPLRVVAVVSPSSLDGKTTVAVNLAVTAALEGRRVLAIDADLEGQGLGFVLLGDERDGAGLIQVVQGRTPLSQAVRLVAPDLPGLHVLPSGRMPRSPLELFTSEGCRRLLEQLRGEYDLIIIDVPPLLQIAYASALTQLADGVVVVVAHQSPVNRLEELADRLALLDVPVAGYVYNKAPLRREVGRHSRLVTDTKRRSTGTRLTPRPTTAEPAHAFPATRTTSRHRALSPVRDATQATQAAQAASDGHAANSGESRVDPERAPVTGASSTAPPTAASIAAPLAASLTAPPPASLTAPPTAAPLAVPVPVPVPEPSSQDTPEDDAAVGTSPGVDPSPFTPPVRVRFAGSQAAGAAPTPADPRAFAVRESHESWVAAVPSSAQRGDT